MQPGVLKLKSLLARRNQKRNSRRLVAGEPEARRWLPRTVHQHFLEQYSWRRVGSCHRLRINDRDAPVGGEAEPPIPGFQTGAESDGTLLGQHAIRPAEHVRVELGNPAGQQSLQVAPEDMEDAAVGSQPQIPIVVFQDLKDCVISYSLLY